MRSGDDLKKLENLSSCREVHMYGYDDMSWDYYLLVESRKIELKLSASDANVNILHARAGGGIFKHVRCT